MNAAFGRGSPRPSRRTAFGFLFLALVVSGCGDDDPSGASATSAPVPTTVPAVEAPEASVTTVAPSVTSDSDPTVSETTDPARTIAAPVPTDSTASAIDGIVVPSGPCPPGEFPSVGTVGLHTGVVGWVSCDAAQVWRKLYGVRDDLLVVIEELPESADVVAVDPTDGTEIWRRPGSKQRLPAGDPMAGDVLVLSADGQWPWGAAGVDALSGEEIWRIDEPLEVYGMTEDVVVVTTYVELAGAEPLRGLDRSTGQELWRSDVKPLDNSGTYGGWMPAAVAGNLVVVPTGESTTAVDVATGNAVWTGPELADVHAVEGVVTGFAGRNSPGAERIVALEATTGVELWDAPGAVTYGGVTAAGDGIVTVLDYEDLTVVAYELTHGGERWRVSTSGQPQLVAGDLVVLMWAAVEARSTNDGTVAWLGDQPFGSPLMSNLLAHGETLYVAINSRPWAD